MERAVGLWVRQALPTPIPSLRSLRSLPTLAMLAHGSFHSLAMLAHFIPPAWPVLVPHTHQAAVIPFPPTITLLAHYVRSPIPTPHSSLATFTRSTRSLAPASWGMVNGPG